MKHDEAVAVWKFALPMNDFPVVRMPRGATVLHAAKQDEELYLWAVVTPTSPMVDRTFRVAGTGHPLLLTESQAWATYVNTVHMLGGKFVVHIFDLGERGEVHD